MERICTRQGNPHAGTVTNLRQCRPVYKLELVLAFDDAKQFRRRIGRGATVPRLVTLLLPDIKRLAVKLVDRGFGDGHRARVAFKEEIHVINIPVGAGQIHTGKMTPRPQIRQVLGMDTNQLK